MAVPHPAPVDVFMLGAGFSREISAQLPLTADLFDLCVDAMRTLGLETAADGDVLDAFPRLGGDVETWLTWLASDQPWLSEASRFRNRAAFADISRALAGVILESQNRAITDSGGAPPPWLHGLVGTWANKNAAVITCNYDALVEKAYEVALRNATSVILYSFMPEALDGGARLGGGAKPGYRFPLYKLHGSITWYVFPGDGHYGPIYDAGFITGWEPPDDLAALVLRAGARQPLIVPPVISKEPFFARPELRDQWMRAGYSLQHADRLFLLGYRVPEADLTARFLLDRAHPDCEVIPVNQDPGVATKIEALLRPRTVNVRFSGRVGVIQELAEAYSSGAPI